MNIKLWENESVGCNLWPQNESRSQWPLYIFVQIENPGKISDTIKICLTFYQRYSIGRPLSSVCMYVCQHFHTSSPLKPLGRLKPNYMWILLGWGNESLFKRSRSHDQDGHLAHIWSKNLLYLLRNQKVYDLETWCVVSGARVLPRLFKWWHLVDLKLLFGKVKGEGSRTTRIGLVNRGKNQSQWIKVSYRFFVCWTFLLVGSALILLCWPSSLVL